MGKTPSPGKWIKSLLGKKSSKSSLEKGTDKVRSAKKEELVVKAKDNNNNVSNLPTNPIPVVSSQEEVAATQTVLILDAAVPENQPSGDIKGDESNANSNLESGNATEEFKLEEKDATKAREESQMLKGAIKLQAVVRGHLVRRQAVSTYSCIWGIVKFQALARGKIARSSETGAQLQKIDSETENSETLQGSTYSWFEGSTKVSMIDKLLVSPPTSSPLKIQYGPEDPNSAKVWLERWTQLQVWAPGPLVVKSFVPKSQTKQRSFQAVEADKGKLKRGIKKPPGGLNTGNSRSTAENDKPKRSVRKASTLGKEVNDKSKQSSRKSTSAIKEGSSLEVKDEKPRTSLQKASLSNRIEKPKRKPAEKKKEIVDSVLPSDKVSASVVNTPEEQEEEKVKDSPETISKEIDLETDEKAPVLDNLEEDELKPTEEELPEPEVQISSSENGNALSEDTKPSHRRASLPAKIENQHQDDGLTTQSGRKIPSYMAPTASAKARVRGGQGSPRIVGQEKPEKNGTTTRRHSLPHIVANDKLSAMSPRAHRLLIASAKGSMNSSDRSFSSSKDIGDKSTKVEWKR